MNLARRSVASITWNAVASVVQVGVGVVRSILLARWLSVEVFGVYNMATSIVRLSAVVFGFGMNEAFLHRAAETEDEDHAAAVWFTLKLILSSVWFILIGLGAFQFAEGPDRIALLVIALAQWGMALTAVPRQILVRRVVHRRLALLQSVDLLLSAIVAIFLASRGVGLWALLCTDIVTIILSVYFLYIRQPVWRPYLAWSPSTVRYFLSFGSRSLLAQELLHALDRLDDLWTGAYLGRAALGYYSRAYAFATYPRTVLATSVNKVAGGTYAELAKNRKRLSRAFFRTNAFLVRSGFFLGGLMALVAPELIRLLLGTKWLPMLTAFRLMLIFTLLDPIKITVANLFVAVGQPDEIVKARLIQLAVMIIGLFSLGLTQGIAGVALSVDIMLVVGVAVLLWQARSHVDFSFWTLFSAPAIALILSMIAARAAIMLPGILGSPWRTGFVKMVVFTVGYSTTLVVLERRQLLRMLSFLTDELTSKKSGLDEEEI